MKYMKNQLRNSDHQNYNFINNQIGVKLSHSVKVGSYLLSISQDSLRSTDSLLNEANCCYIRYSSLSKIQDITDTQTLNNGLMPHCIHTSNMVS